VFITNNQARPILYENTSDNANGWLIVETEGAVSNRNGIGATITIDPDLSIVGDEQHRFIDGGSNFLSQNQTFAHFGLADAPGVDRVTVQWPSGIVQQFFDVSRNTVLSVVEAELTGDLDGDGFVGIGDLNIVLGNWNRSVLPGLRLQGDPDGDGFVGIQDLNLVLGNWNAGAPPPAHHAFIPEPATATLFCLALLLDRPRPHRRTSPKPINP